MPNPNNKKRRNPKIKSNETNKNKSNLESSIEPNKRIKKNNVVNLNKVLSKLAENSIVHDLFN